MNPYHSWPLTMTIQGNTIVDLTSPYAMWLNALGGYLLIDNVIESPAGQSVSPIHVRNWDWDGGLSNAYILAAGNTFTVASPYSFWIPAGRHRSRIWGTA